MTAIVRLACGCSKMLDGEWRIVDVRLCEAHVDIFTWLDFNNLQPKPEPPVLGGSVIEVVKMSDEA